MTRVEPQSFSRYFGVSLVKPVFLLDAVVATQDTAREQTSASAGTAVDVLKLPRVWRPNTFPPERHRGYAATWFGFALTSIIIFLLLHRIPTPKKANRPDE